MQNLERRYNTLVHEQNAFSYATAEKDYALYINKEVSLHPLVLGFIKEGKIDKRILAHLVFIYNEDTQTKKVVVIPDFLNSLMSQDGEIFTKLKSWDYLKKQEEKGQLSQIPVTATTSFDPNNKTYFAWSLGGITRLHNDLMEKLSYVSTGFHFDDQSGTLEFQNKLVTISKSKNTNPYHLLQTLIKDPMKIWGYDEIHEDWNNLEPYRKTDWEKYYQTGYAVNEKVAKETTIKDFLLVTRTSIRINPKYQPGSL